MVIFQNFNVLTTYILWVSVSLKLCDEVTQSIIMRSTRQPNCARRMYSLKLDIRLERKRGCTSCNVRLETANSEGRRGGKGRSGHRAHDVHLYASRACAGIQPGWLNQSRDQVSVDMSWRSFFNEVGSFGVPTRQGSGTMREHIAH